MYEYTNCVGREYNEFAAGHSVAYKKYRAGEIPREQFASDEEILIDLLKADSAKRWVELLFLRLIDRVRGGHDNLTVLTLMIM